jgi:hypothetical protein
MDHWGQDHWSMFAYMATVMFEYGGFQCGFDPKMRQNRRNFRIMMDQYPYPKRNGKSNAKGMVMDERSKSRLTDAEASATHDDWHCVQDMANAGLLNVTAGQVQPGVWLHFSERGYKYLDLLNKHKMTGGSFSDFHPLTLQIEVL